jgi:hypothetical protein
MQWNNNKKILETNSSVVSSCLTMFHYFALDRKEILKKFTDLIVLKIVLE